ncbi:MAG TPA: SURF1 family protein [Roseiflexaceae bacterium]|nr:SURF1 family protein [Roseiflexaceae bacterium]
MLKYLLSGRRLIMTPLVLLAAAAMCGLGGWQLNRYNQRMALNDHINSQMAAEPLVITSAPVDPEELDYRRVAVRGTFDQSQEILLRNRSYQGTTGYHLLTPLRLSGSDHAVLVDRGWIPLTEARPEQRAAFAPPAGEVEVIGVARRSQDQTGPQDPPLAPDRPRLDAWFRITIPRIQQQVSYPLLPVFIEMQFGPETSLNLPIPGTTSDLGPGSHLSYVIQWFSFALIAVVGYLALMNQQRKK